MGALAALVLTVGAGGQGGKPSHHGVDRASPPVEVPAYVLVGQNPGELINSAADSACRFARTQPDDSRRLLILPFGRAIHGPDGYGVSLHAVNFTNDQVYDALTAAAAAYEGCRDDIGGHGKSVVMAYGVGNVLISLEPPGVPAKIGHRQYLTAKRLQHDHWPHVTAALAGDIEPGYDPGAHGTYPAGASEALVRGAAGRGLDYYDYGTAGLCPPIASCQGGWSAGILGRISRGYGQRGPGSNFAIPEVYVASQARQWARVRSNWNRGPRSGYGFGGATSEPETCGYTHLSPDQSWKTLRRQNRGASLARELIFFNPDGVLC